MSTMSTSSERITAAELERSKRARTIAKNWLEAEYTRLQLAGLDPALENDGNPGAQMRPSRRLSPLDRIKEARISGLEIKEFSKGLGDETSTSKPAQINPATLVEQKSLIIRAPGSKSYARANRAIHASPRTLSRRCSHGRLRPCRAKPALQSNDEQRGTTGPHH